MPEAERGLLPDMGEILSHVGAHASARARFGVPRLPAAHMPHMLPRAALAAALAARCSRSLHASGRAPADWPYDLAVAAQWQMLTGRDRLALPLAARIVMEAAIPMSKVDPRTVPGA